MGEFSETAALYAPRQGPPHRCSDIGGGICSLLCAHMLREAGVDYVLAEAETLCGGITKNTTAKISARHGLFCHRLIREFGIEKAKLYVQANPDAVEQYARLCRDMDCDFAYRDFFVYSLEDGEKLRRELRAMERLGLPGELQRAPLLPFPTAGAVSLPRQAQFHPLKFAAALSRELNIFERTRVRELIGTTAVTGGGVIRAKRIIVATHFPFLNKHGGYFLKLYQHRSYVLTLENAPLPEGMYVAAGFNKWGMSSSMAAALLLRDLLLGKESPYALVFSPSRSILHPQLGINAWEAAVNLLRPAPRRCPHLGCALQWNPREHSWDCPCHGSRFTASGKLIDNPATGDLKKYEGGNP